MRRLPDFTEGPRSFGFVDDTHNSDDELRHLYKEIQFLLRREEVFHGDWLFGKPYTAPLRAHRDYLAQRLQAAAGRRLKRCTALNHPDPVIRRHSTICSRCGGRS